MKKTLLLLGFLFIGMISFANIGPTHDVVLNQRTALVRMVSPNTSRAFTEGFHSKTDEVVAKSPKLGVLANLNVDVQPSCTVKTEITIGYNGSGITVECAATAATCKAALQMLLDCMP